jgi:LytS/YehU family sensor histidine kinase
MWAYIFISIGVILSTFLMLYIDSRLFDRPKRKMVYIKVMCMNVIIVLTTIYVLTWLSSTSNIKDVIQSGGKPKITSNSVVLTDINEEMLTGIAPF